jgi:hypothetical protein
VLSEDGELKHGFQIIPMNYNSGHGSERKHIAKSYRQIIDFVDLEIYEDRNQPSPIPLYLVEAYMSQLTFDNQEHDSIRC